MIITTKNMRCQHVHPPVSFKRTILPTYLWL